MKDLLLQQLHQLMPKTCKITDTYEDSPKSYKDSFSSTVLEITRSTKYKYEDVTTQELYYKFRYHFRNNTGILLTKWHNLSSQEKESWTKVCEHLKIHTFFI